MNPYDIKSFGAKGDGIAKDTRAVQSALDACAQSGGGTVLVPPGIFLCGTLYLRDHTTLHLEAGATIRGSPDLADYNADDAYPQNGFCKEENWTGAHLLIALEARQVALTGQGTIDGNSAAFFGPPLHNRPGFSIKDRRPGQMICFVECTHVTIRDVSLVNATSWTLFLHGCESCIVSGIRISNPRGTPNGDGLDIDSCRDVTVSDCIIRSSDDSITLRGNNAGLKQPNRACENVVVTNCLLSSGTCGIRVGVGDGIVRNCRVSNCVMTDCRTGIHMISSYAAGFEGGDKKGCTIERIAFSNLTLDAKMPFWILSGDSQTAAIRDISFSHLRISARMGGYIAGSRPGLISDLLFSDLDLDFTEADLPPLPRERLAPNLREWDFLENRLPFGIFLLNAHRVTFRHLFLRVAEGPLPHLIPVGADNCQTVCFDHPSLEIPNPSSPARMIDCLRGATPRIVNGLLNSKPFNNNQPSPCD